jgi:hypothetical protein
MGSPAEANGPGPALPEVGVLFQVRLKRQDESGRAVPEASRSSRYEMAMVTVIAEVEDEVEFEVGRSPTHAR